jgi:RimJ/RimL family protein N-acetyltransferase
MSKELPALMYTPVLTTDRLMLRAPKASDESAWADFIGDARSHFVGGPLERGRQWRSFASLIGHWVMRGCGGFVLQLHEDPTPLGQVGPWYPGDWPEPEISWTLWSAEAEGNGYVTEAARAVLHHVFDDLGWPTAVSYIDPKNSRSIEVARRLGATVDADATRPEADLLVYRHPRPR